jgi:predicted O-methyltransferase YrrM
MMRHRTPRYVVDRVRQLRYERSHPGDPWLTPEAIRLLASLLRRSDRGLEFGSGRSTVWLAERVHQLTSVEHDERWHATVSGTLRARGLENVDYVLAPRDEPDEHGDRSRYTRTALRFGAESIDFALIDGMYRDHTASLVMPRIRPGGLLIIDNVNWYLPSGSRAPNSRTAAQGPAGRVWAQIAESLADWRTIWTTSGVWDTAVFVKPRPAR